MQQSKKYLIVVTGPTAIGKTAFSIKLAQHFESNEFKFLNGGFQVLGESVKRHVYEAHEITTYQMSK